MSQATVEAGGGSTLQPQSQPDSDASSLSPRHEPPAGGASVGAGEGETEGHHPSADGDVPSEPKAEGDESSEGGVPLEADASSDGEESSELGSEVEASTPVVPEAGVVTHRESPPAEKEPAVNEPSSHPAESFQGDPEGSSETDPEGSGASQDSHDINEPAPLSPGDHDTGELIDLDETADAEDLTPISSDHDLPPQPLDVKGVSQLSPDIAEDIQHVPGTQDSAQLAPEIRNGDHLVYVNESGSSKPSQIPADRNATPQVETPKFTQEPPAAKVPVLTVPDSGRSVNHSPDVNGSAPVAPNSPVCSEFSADGDDSTPLLIPSDESHLPSTTTSTATRANNNDNNSSTRALRSRRLRPVKIPIPDRCLSSKRMATSLEDITSLRLWKGIIAEFVGVLLLVLVGCGSCQSLDDQNPSSVVQISLCFGLSVATIVWIIGHISGGHINPAVTLALLATRKISLAKAIFFVLFQLVGAVVGAGILMGLTPTKYQETLGNTLVNDKLDPGKGLGVEIFITFVLVFTVFSSIDSRRKDLNGSTPLTIGLSVTMCHLFAVPYTGASMNTARSFGPALVTGIWDNHWVYWVGPITGGVAAGLLYEYLFAVNASLTKVRACVLSSDYDDDKFQAKKIKVRIVEEDPEAPEGDTMPLTPSEEKSAGESQPAPLESA